MSEFNYSKYVNEFAKENYDRIIVNVKKGQKESIDKFRKERGYSSLNAYINELIRRDMNGEKENHSKIKIETLNQNEGGTININ